jgi:single-strand DNA-binding protein
MNLVLLTGRVGRDPEVKTFSNGDRVARLSLATRRRRKDPQSGQMVEQADWHNVSFYGPAQGGVVDRVVQLARKGALITIRGELVYQVSTLPDGTKIQRASIAVRGQDGFEFHIGARADGEPTTQRPKTPLPAGETTAEVYTGVDPSDDLDPLGLGAFDDDDI